MLETAFTCLNIVTNFFARSIKIKIIIFTDPEKKKTIFIYFVKAASLSYNNSWNYVLKLQVTQIDLHRHFHALGAGVIEEVRIQRDKGFGFVRYSNHSEAALAIQMGNNQSILYGKIIKVCLL